MWIKEKALLYIYRNKVLFAKLIKLNVSFLKVYEKKFKFVAAWFAGN